MSHKLILCCTLAVSFVVGVLVIVTPAWADSTITVTTTSDIIASDGLCSLREAVIAANTDSAYSECPAGSGADTIEFSSNLPLPATFVLTNTGAGEDSAATGDLDIMGTLTINGAGSDNTTVDGNGTDRVFEILPGARVTISGVKVYNGNPGSGADGGGVAVAGVLTLTHSTVFSNTALRGGGIHVLGRLNLSTSDVVANDHGGIRNDGGLLTLNDVQVRNNGGYGIRNENGGTLSFTGGLVSGHQGGGIYSRSSYVTLSSVAVISNTGGGGVFNIGLGTNPAWLTMNACSVMSNTATNGGGIFSQGLGARANIYNTDISGNTATSAGGGVYNSGLMTLNGSTLRHNQARSGGGIDHLGTSLAMTNDTISGNTATDNGGGLYNRGDALLTNLTFSGNSTGAPDTGGNIFNQEASLSIVNTIVALAGGGGNCFNSDGFINSLGYNLEDADTCGFAATGDITNTNPLLGPLQDNGGATLTHALLAGSPAIDNGDDTACPATDQRGLPRPQGAACDIGAYEFGATALLSIVKTVETAHTPVRLGDSVTYTIVVANAGDVDASTVRVTDTLPVGVTGMDLDWTGTITAGDQVVFPIPATVTTSVVWYGQTITNSAYYSHTSGSGSHSASFTIESAPAPALTITKTVETAHTPVKLGDPVTYTISIANHGTAVATGVVMTDALPLGVTFGGWADQGSAMLPAPGNVLSWGPWDIPAGQLYAFGFTATVMTSAVYSGELIINTVTYASINAGDGSDAAGFLVESAAGPDLSGSTKVSSAANQQLMPGDLVTYTIILDNSGGQDASAVVTDVLGSYYAVHLAQDLFESPTGTLTWSGTVTAGQQVVLRFVARVVNAADLPLGTTTLNNALSVDDGVNPVFSVHDVSPPWLEIHSSHLPLILRSGAGTVIPPDPASAIEIEKHTNGHDADLPTGPFIPVDDPVVWEYVVTNVGSVALTNVTVVDDQGIAVSCPQNNLDVGESITCTGSGTAMAGQHANLGTACGDDAGQTVCDEDISHYYGEKPDVQGCSPGYWSAKQHLDAWELTPYRTDDLYAAVFGVSYPKTLLESLKTGGGGERALGRHAVAALLNATHPDVDYSYTAAEVIAFVQQAYATGEYEEAKDLLEEQNGDHTLCPLD